MVKSFYDDFPYKQIGKRIEIMMEELIAVKAAGLIGNTIKMKSYGSFYLCHLYAYNCCGCDDFELSGCKT